MVERSFKRPTEFLKRETNVREQSVLYGIATDAGLAKQEKAVGNERVDGPY